MNRESSVTYVEPSADVSIENTKKLIDYIRSLSTLPTSSPLVTPIITPRFAISCTDDLLKGLGELASSDLTLPIQTHISENVHEIEKTMSLFPGAQSYADVYDMFGLLRHNTILAHACHLSEDEIELVKHRGAGISHCPTSNFNLRSGVAPVGLYLDRGIKVRTIRYPHVLLRRRKHAHVLGRAGDGRLGGVRAVDAHGNPTRIDRREGSHIFLADDGRWLERRSTHTRSRSRARAPAKPAQPHHDDT